LRKTRSSKESESTDDACCSTAFETYTSASETDQAPVTTTLRELTRWTTTYPITNEMTHFSAIMDPAEGRIAWIKRYMTPLEFEDE
jgi:hypothetical protein